LPKKIYNLYHNRFIQCKYTIPICTFDSVYKSVRLIRVHRQERKSAGRSEERLLNLKIELVVTDGNLLDVRQRDVIEMSKARYSVVPVQLEYAKYLHAFRSDEHAAGKFRRRPVVQDDGTPENVYRRIGRFRRSADDGIERTKIGDESDVMAVGERVRQHES